MALTGHRKKQDAPQYHSLCHSTGGASPGARTRLCWGLLREGAATSKVAVWSGRITPGFFFEILDADSCFLAYFQPEN